MIVSRYQHFKGSASGFKTAVNADLCSITKFCKTIKKLIYTLMIKVAKHAPVLYHIFQAVGPN